MSALTDKAKSRLTQAFADSTSKSYHTKFRIVVGFCCFASINMSPVTPLAILTFLEFLTFNKTSSSGLSNYLSAVKSILSSFGADISAFNNSRIRLYNKAIMRHRPLNPSIKPLIDNTTLQAIITQADRMYMGQMFKAAILLPSLAL